VARSLALVSDPAAPRSVVGVIGPTFRAVNANRQQIVAQWIVAKNHAIPRGWRTTGRADRGRAEKKLKKSLAPGGLLRGDQGAPKRATKGPTKRAAATLAE
jgi:hypothetical protein